MNHNPATGAIAPRKRCGTTWPQAVLVIADFQFTAWLIHHGMAVESAAATASGLTAVVLLLTSIRASGLRVFATSLANPQQDPIPGMF